jgi:hypothetical protein
MVKIYTVGSKNNQPLLDLGYEVIDFGHVSSNDIELHDFILLNIKDLAVDKLVIEISKEDLKALKLAYHIRLSLNELRRSSLIPILFVSDKSLKQIISSNGIWSHIFATKGVGYAPYNLAKIEIQNLEGLGSGEYKTHFLDIINVLPDETVGKHSIANQWGAFVMDKSANTFALLGEKDIMRTFNKLYFKYSDAFNFDYRSLVTKTQTEPDNVISGRPNQVKAQGYKILLIDDEADKGWEKVLRKVFCTTNIDDFQVINEQVKDYEAFSTLAKDKIENGNFDLFLIDLRLNGAQEEEVHDVNEFSGAKVLKEIKKNKGNQVIIFTASNKAWNIEPLLNSGNYGADAYYIKESPDYKFTTSLSEANYSNFKSNAEKLLSRNYLRKLFLEITDLKKKVNSLKTSTSYSVNFLSEISNFLDQSFDMHYRAGNDRQFAFAYVTLNMIIERINTEFVTAVGRWDDKEWYVGSENLKDWNWNARSNCFQAETNSKLIGNKASEAKKMIGIWKQKFGGLATDDSVIKPINDLIKKRNDFIHNESGLDISIYSKRGYKELFGLISKIVVRM